LLEREQITALAKGPEITADKKFAKKRFPFSGEVPYSVSKIRNSAFNNASAYKKLHLVAALLRHRVLVCPVLGRISGRCAFGTELAELPLQ
jgi:hypothetical protein